jgi:hypothetical protein
MPLADWTVPFLLTSADYSASMLSINTQTANGLYLLRPEGCSLVNQVRSSKEMVPQEDGAILHRRFAAGMEMTLAIQLWETNEKIACDTLLQTMLDTLMGYLYGLLNADDNEGRIQWLPDGNSSAASSYRMLDDIRLASYPAESQQPGSPYEITVTVDCELPYAEDATQASPSLSGGSGTITNYGNRPLYPVWKLYGPFAKVTLTNTTPAPDTQFIWDEALPGAGAALTNAEYLEIDTFRNTVTKFAAGPVLSNAAAGIDMVNSEFFLIPPGANAITVAYTSGNATNNNSSVALINSAFA